jgi:hypothetical protein
MPAKTPPSTFTVDLDAVEVPRLDLGGKPAEEDAAKQRRKGRDRGGPAHGAANHGLRAAPQPKRYAFRRS